MEGYERIIFLPDIHVPYEDEDALGTALAFIRHFKPNYIFILGDLLDCYSLSRFDKDPARLLQLPDEIKKGKQVLKAIRHVAPKAKITYVRGNHELRITKYLWRHAAELSTLPALALPILLGFKELGIKYIENGSLNFKGLMIKHGKVTRSKSGYSGYGEMERSGISGVSGHTHRLGQIYKSNLGGMFTWVEAGCLCNLYPEYLEGEPEDWQHGLAYGYFEPGRGNRFLVHTLPIIKRKVVFGGKVIRHGCA